MPPRRFRCTWDDIAYLDADHMSGWGAFHRGCRQTIDFDDDDLPRIAFAMNHDRDEFLALYQWRENGRIVDSDFMHAHVSIERRPCRFGGTRAYFIAPCCGRRTLRLAVLSGGLRCGRCGRVTWGSQRERPTQRLIRRANKVALKLGLDCWYAPTAPRPAHMRMAEFAQLSATRDQLAAEINRRISTRLARSGVAARLAYVFRS